MKIGFIGTGVMGNSIAQHLLNNKQELFVYNRTKQKTDNLVEKGATWCQDPQTVTQKSDLVFTMLGFPQDVEEVYFGNQGIFKTDVKDKILVDLTTSKPTLAQKIFDYGTKLGAQVLDAPVSGGDVGAKNGTLTIMVGGLEETYKKVEPIFAMFGAQSHLFGKAGAGQNTKMANQIMIAGTMTGMCEMLAYAKSADLNLEDVLNTVGGGSAANWSLSNYGPRILKNDFAPGFFSKHFLKDLRIALDTAQEMKLDLPATKQAEQLYDKLVNQKNLGDLGTQALIQLWWS